MRNNKEYLLEVIFKKLKENSNKINLEKKEDVKMHLKDLRKELKRMHLTVTEELLLPQPDEVKTLMYKMDQLLKVIQSK